MIFWTYFAICVTFVVFTRAQYDSCYTPHNQPGSCINIKQCAPLVKLLQQRPISPTDLDYLRQSSCGFDGSTPKVCCPSGGQNQGTTPRPTSRPVPTTPSRGGETNLLPDLNQCGIVGADKIVGGEATELDEFPWMALLEYQKPVGRGFYCGGVLISKRYVLTAAHCVKGKDIPRTWSLISVRLGEYDTEQDVDCIAGECADPPINIPIEEQIAHEEYVPTSINQYHDIALLRLVKDAPSTDFIRPICLPRPGSQWNDLYVAGWGKTESKSESNIKLKVKVPPVDSNRCSSTYNRASVTIGDGQLCAGGERGKDSCRGDSGGPLMTISSEKSNANWYAIGVVSFGPSPCGMPGWPGVYTNVIDYVPWITSKMRG